MHSFPRDCMSFPRKLGVSPRFRDVSTVRLNLDRGQDWDRNGPSSPAAGSSGTPLAFPAAVFNPNMESLVMKSIAAGLVALATLGLASTAMAADGKAVYEQTCAMCHAAGVAGAPKLGDKAAWAPRVATGKAALVASVTNGKNAMPAKGGNANLKADEIAAAVDYILSQTK